MKVLLAKSAGFCYGVKRAVELAAKTGEETGGCWMLGDLIHNSHVVEDLARRDMEDASIDQNNYEELSSRIDAYIAEFEEHGTDNILVDSDIM